MLIHQLSSLFRSGERSGLKIVADRSGFKCSHAILVIGKEPVTEQGVIDRAGCIQEACFFCLFVFF